MGYTESAVIFYSKAVCLLVFILVEAPCLILNPPFSLTNTERYRIQNYIDALINRENSLRSLRMALFKPEDQTWKQGYSSSIKQTLWWNFVLYVLNYYYYFFFLYSVIVFVYKGHMMVFIEMIEWFFGFITCFRTQPHKLFYLKLLELGQTLTEVACLVQSCFDSNWVWPHF